MWTPDEPLISLYLVSLVAANCERDVEDWSMSGLVWSVRMIIPVLLFFNFFICV